MFEKYDSIYIYGYNNWGRNVYNKVRAVFLQKKVAILVSQMARQKRETIIGKEIIELKDVNPSKKDLVILGMSPINKKELEERLRECGFEHIIGYSHDIDDFLNNSLEEIPKLEVRFLSVCVGQACNLKCKNCANFAPYAHKENMRYHIESIKANLDKLLPCFKEIDTFHIQGGEPLLYSDLDKLLTFMQTKYGHIIKNIQIATNGTIIPSEDILDVMKTVEAVVRISNYPIESKVDELIALLKEKEIRYRVYNFANSTGEWSDAGAMDYTISKEKDVVRQVFECGWNTCFTIENGLVGRCARSIPALTLQNVPMRELDYIDLSKELDIKKVHKYFTITSPMACCMHCKGTTGEPIKPAIQI